MTFRPKRTIFALNLALCSALLLSSCFESEEALDPLTEAQVKLEEGDPYSAEMQLQRLLDSGTPKKELAAYMGEAYLRQGKYKKAREWLGGQNFSKDTRARGQFILGQLDMAQGKLRDALKAFDRSFRAGGESPELWVNVGQLRSRGGDNVMAMKAAKRAIKLDPKNPLANVFRGQMARDSEGLEAGLSWFEKGLEANPDHPQLLSEAAATLGELGRAKEMLKRVRHLATVAPDNLNIYYLQAVLAARAGDYDLANSLLLRSKKLDKEVPAALLLSGVIELERGNYATAAQTFMHLRSLQPNNRRVLLLLGRALSLSGSDIELTNYYPKFPPLIQSSSYMQTLVGMSYENMGKREEAAKFYAMAARAKTNMISVIGANPSVVASGSWADAKRAQAVEFVRAAAGSGNPALAATIAASFHNKAPNSTLTRTLRGDAALAGNKLGEAQGFYTDAARIKFIWPLAYKMSTVTERMGDNGRAAETLGYFLTRERFNPEALLQLAQNAASQGDWNAARKYSRQALKFGGRQDAALLTLNANAALNDGDAEAAIRVAKEALALQPLNLEAAQILADAYEADGAPADVVEVARLRVSLLAKK